MTVHPAFRYELDPTVRQQRRLAKAAGTARYACNWGLNLCKRFIADAGWAEFGRMLEYTTQCYGSALIVAPRFYPSTKKCSACGRSKAEMPLGERVFQCEVSGAEIDRDLNAARNPASLVAGSSPETQNACGAEGSGQENGLVKPAAAKQEPLSRKPAATAVGNKRP